MDKGKLAALSRDGLIERAEALGVRRARYLTRPELVDEILLAESKVEGDKRGITRGFVGLARDLLARLVERGLHLPDAAERIRGAAVPPRPRSQASSIPTVTLAEIYAAQGHLARAIDTLERLLKEEPEHEEAQQMLAALKQQVPTGRAAADAENETSEESPEAEGAASEVASTEAAPAEAAPTEPLNMLDDGPLPPRYDVDECVALPVDPRTVFVYWELREETLAKVAARVGGGGVIALRVAVLEPTWDGPTYSRFECDVFANLGEYFLRELPEGAVVRVAVGYRNPQGEFTALAHSELFEAANADRSAMPSPVLYSWSPAGMAAVERTGREAAFLAEALHASKSPDLQQLAVKFGATALGTWRSSHVGSSRSA